MSRMSADMESISVNGKTVLRDTAKAWGNRFSGGANMDTEPLLRVPQGIRLMAGTGNLPASVHPAQQKRTAPNRAIPSVA